MSLHPENDQVSRVKNIVVPGFLLIDVLLPKSLNLGPWMNQSEPIKATYDGVMNRNSESY